MVWHRNTAAGLLALWSECDSTCLASSDACAPGRYRTCAVGGGGSSAFTSLLNCTCPAHVECVVSLKVGYRL